MSDNQVTDPVARVRDIATLLPGVDEQLQDGETVFLVEQQAFARVDSDGALHVRTSADEASWTSVDLSAGTDWTLVEDAVSRSWELTAPTGLLEAGGR